MSDVTLTAATRSALQLLQRTNDVRTEATRELATGRRVELPTDDPAAFFQAEALRDRVRDLLVAKDNIGQAQSAVDGALLGLDAIEDLAGQLKGIALSAQGTSAEARQAAAEQFDVIRQQITALANDASFGGVALLAESPGNLSVPLNEDGSASLLIEGHQTGSAGLGIGSAGTDYANFATDADIASAVNAVNAALTTIRSRAAGFANDLSVLGLRDDFNQNLTETLSTGAARLVDADLNETGARLVSSQVRQQLGVESLRLAGQSESLLASII